MSNNTTHTVAGMTCGSCATKVSEAVSDLDGVTTSTNETSTLVARRPPPSESTF